MLKQCEKHDGPHAPWFWDVRRSGGGVTLDMGCHAFEFFRWILGKPQQLASGSGNRDGVQSQSHETPRQEIMPLVKPRAVSVVAEMGTFVHGQRTQGEDNAILAAYASAGSGQKVSLPFATEVSRPIQLWKPGL